MTRVRVVELAGIAMCTLALAGMVLTADLGTWDPFVLAILFALVIGADMLEVEAKGMYLSGSFLGVVLAMALLGPAPAAALGMVGSLARTWRVRPPFVSAVVNLAAASVPPLVGGLLLLGLSGALGLGITQPEFILALLPGFTVTVLGNFLCVVGSLKVTDGFSLLERFRTAFVPVIPSELAMVLLAGILVYAFAHIGPIALGVLTGLFFLYLWLLKELAVSQDRAEELDVRTQQLASLQVGVLTAMLKTMAMRDHMTARHCAAVGRYAREIAREAGCTVEQQELVHTAGLLHDIGKFIFPDRILLADTRLNDEDWDIVKRHPYQGAKVVRQVEGYGPVADIILSHHERIDGRGYPRGLHDEEIPVLAKMISIADTYDVMTARDSYRKPVAPAMAIEELRRVSGAQLDGALVECFIRVLERRDVRFRHGDDADFEAELQFERRVSEYAAPRRAGEERRAA